MLHSGFSHYESFKEHDVSLIDAPISNHLLVKIKNWLTFGSMHACMHAWIHHQPGMCALQAEPLQSDYLIIVADLI